METTLDDILNTVRKVTANLPISQEKMEKQEMLLDFYRGLAKNGLLEVNDGRIPYALAPENEGLIPNYVV